MLPPAMMAAYLTESPSSLELMLAEIQQREEKPRDTPPALPARPVVKARLPRTRKQLPLRFDKSGSEEIEGKVSNSSSKWRSTIETRISEKDAIFGVFCQEETADFDGLAASGLGIGVDGENCGNFADSDVKKELEGTTESKIGGILNVQRYFRGYQARREFNELRRKAIALQSFVRGENARKYRQSKGKTLPLRCYLLSEDQLMAVTRLQSGIRGWLTRKHLNVKQTRKISSDSVMNLEDRDLQTEVPHSVLVDLKRRILRTEAELRKKEEENSALKVKIHQYELRWQQYEENMNSMEKMWQDQLSSLQIRLAAARTCLPPGTPLAKLFLLDSSPVHQDQNVDITTTGMAYTPRRSEERVNGGTFLDGETHGNGTLNSTPDYSYQQKTKLESDHNRFTQSKPKSPNSRHSPDHELGKLKRRFEAWKKDYKTRLQEVKASMKLRTRFGKGKSHNIWCGK